MASFCQIKNMYIHRVEHTIRFKLISGQSSEFWCMVMTIAYDLRSKLITVEKFRKSPNCFLYCWNFFVFLWKLLFFWQNFFFILTKLFFYFVKTFLADVFLQNFVGVDWLHQSFPWPCQVLHWLHQCQWFIQMAGQTNTHLLNYITDYYIVISVQLCWKHALIIQNGGLQSF